MSDDEKDVRKKWAEMSWEEYAQKNEDYKKEYKESKIWRGIKKIVFLPARMLGAFMGITKDNIITSKSTGGGGGYHSTVHNFKSSHHVDIPQRSHSDWVREEIAQEAYMKMVDGKGDHDCGHEH